MIGEIGERSSVTRRPRPLPGIGEIGEMRSDKEPIPPPQEFMKSLTDCEISEMRSDT